jgi:hypothetical protein
VCGICGQPLTDGYFTLNNSTVHGECKDKVLAHFGGKSAGSGIVRFLKAGVFGFVFGLGGTLVWYLVEHLLNAQIGLVSILIGWLVGTGVSRGSNAVGGWPYQLLAVVLTYMCICFAWVPDLASEFGKQRRARVEAQADAPADTATDAAPADAPEKSNPPIPFPFNYVAAVFVSLIIPFTGALGVLGVLIAGFGLFEAWRRNRKVVLNITGPFSLSGAPIAVPTGPTFGVPPGQ